MDQLLKEQVAGFVEAVARLERDNIVLVIETSSPGGDLYRIPGTSSFYRASAPGQPPAVREGLYRDSWKVTPAVVEGDTVTASAYSDRRVGSQKQWLLGLLFEMGTERMARRPHIGRATELTEKEAQALLKELNRG